MAIYNLSKGVTTDNRVIIISGVSGVGKSSIIFELEKNIPFVKKSVSVTTRPKRQNEVDGKNYYFVNAKKFLELLHKNEIVEHTKVIGNFYGTLRTELEKIWRSKKYPLLDVDYNGIINLDKLGIKSLKIYLVPPNYNELIRRLISRGISQKELSRRIKLITNELNNIFNLNITSKALPNLSFDKIYTDKYDFIIKNDDFKKTVKKIEKYIRRHEWK